MEFWLFAALMALLATGALFFSLRLSDRSPQPGSVAGELAADRALYEARLREISDDLEAGKLDADSARAATADEARKLIELDSQTATETSGPKTARSSMALAVACLFPPLFAFGFYFATRTPLPPQAPPQTTTAQQNSLPELLAAAEERLKNEPDDLRGWTVVAPVYVRLGQLDQAVNAYRNAVRLAPKDAELKIRLAKTLVLAGQGTVTEEAAGIFTAVSEKIPNHPTAQYYLGLRAAQRNRSDRAREIWQAMVAKASGDEPWVPQVEAQIAALDARADDPALSEAGDEIRQLEPDQQQARIRQMVAGLAQRLEADPDDKAGWLRLIRSYIVLKEPGLAEAAVNKALAQFPEDAEITAMGLEAAEAAKQEPAAPAAEEGTE